MTFLRMFVVVLCAAEALSAQSVPIQIQEIERARQLLNSTRWVDKAWGVYSAARLHQVDLQQELIQQFQSAAVLRDSPVYTDEHAYLYALFDAAIQGDITVPTTLLEPFAEHWTVPVVILAARDKGSEDLLLALRGKKSGDDAVWLAANNLLFERKSQRWYEAILSEITITHQFTVTDPGRGPGFGGGSMGGMGVDGVAAMPRDFPPIAFYILQNSAARGRVFLAQGPENIYYERTVVPTNKQVGFGKSYVILDRMEIRIGYLASLGFKPVKDTVRLFRSESYINYTTNDEFECEVNRRLATQEYEIRTLIQAIGKSGLRAPNVPLRIAPEVIDKRKKATSPLPSFVTRGIVLQ
ncbi:MAG: hypothetical protein ABFD89_03175 [Bryobacteraceae bacterium]